MLVSPKHHFFRFEKIDPALRRNITYLVTTILRELKIEKLRKKIDARIHAM